MDYGAPICDCLTDHSGRFESQLVVTIVLRCANVCTDIVLRERIGTRPKRLMPVASEDGSGRRQNVRGGKSAGGLDHTSV